MALFRLRTTGWGEGGNLNLASLFYGRPRRAAPTAKTQSWAEERPYAPLCNARVPLITPQRSTWSPRLRACISVGRTGSARV